MNPEQLRFSRTGALDIAYRMVGDGPPMIMLHGAEGDHQIYDRLQDALADTITTISFDQRDCGMTRFEGTGPYTLKDIAADAVRLMDALGLEKAHILGNSIGGILAQLVAVHWPERVDCLVLGLTWPVDQQLQEIHPAGIARRAEIAAKGAEGEREMAEFMTNADYIAAHPEIIDEMKGLSTTVAAEARERRMAAFMAPSTANPAAITCRPLVIGGATDNMVPSAITQGLASRLTNSSFFELAGAGHLAVRQFPVEIAGLIRDFLKDGG